MNKEKILTKNFICVFMAQFCCSLVMYMLMTTIGEYVSASGASAMAAGAVSGMYIFGGLISRIGSGSLLNRLGWKKVAVAFLILHFAASLMYFFADSTVMLLTVRLIHGIGFGAGANAIMVIGMSMLPKSRYGEATGYFMLSTSLGIAVGPFAGGLIYDAFGGNGSFFAAAVCSFLSLIFMLFVNTEDVKNDTKINSEKASGIRKYLEPSAIPISSCILCMALGYASIIAFYRMYAQSINMEKEFSFFFIIYAAVVIISRPICGKLQDRFGDGYVCYPSFVLQIVGLVLIAVKPCMITVVICAVTVALGFGTMNSCLNAVLNRKISNERRPYAITTFWVCCDLGVGIGPALLGIIVTYAGFSPMYIAAGAVSLLAVPCFMYANKRKE